MPQRNETEIDDPNLDDKKKTELVEVDDDVVVEVPGGSLEEDDLHSLYDEAEDEVSMWRKATFAEDVPVMDVGESVEVSDVLESSAVMAQRMLISGLRRIYVRGRAYIDPVVQQQPITGQRRVALAPYLNVTDYKADDLIEKLSRGRVITRMSAAPGVGKTSRICGEIATRCNLRVCQVELDAHVAVSAAARQRQTYGLRGGNIRFPRQPGTHLTVMTYDDFRGYVCSSSRKRLFADFDVFYFDEAHSPFASVYLALQYFAVYAQQHNSLVVASATVSTDEGNNTASKRVGEFKTVDLDFRKAVESGKLFTEYMRDRSMVILPSDNEAWYGRQVYTEQGIDVKVLDSASIPLDSEAVKKWMEPEALTPRVLIATVDYGVGSNYPTGFCITTATRHVYDWTPEATIVEKIIPLTERDVTQHKSRTGRGMVTGSGGLVLSTHRGAETELLHSERVKAYIGLVAANIRPLVSQWLDVVDLFPQGLTRDVAMRILSIPLPPVLVLRYLGTDGNVAAFFASAMNLFTEPDHFIVPSKDVYPIGFNQWQSEQYGGYYEGDESVCQSEARVPFVGAPTLKVYMHTLYAVATRRITIERWRPDVMDDDISGSEDEVARFKPKTRVVMPRLVVDVDKVPSPEPPAVPSKWAFDVPPEMQAKRKRRVGRDWASSPKGEASIAELKRALEGTGMIGIMTADVKTDSDTKLVEVRSPGGSITVKLASSLYQKLVGGVVVPPDKFIALLNVVKARHNRLVDSGLFANWGPPWASVFLSCMDNEVVDRVIDEGLVDVMVSFVKKLYDRFRAEVIEVCKSSHIYGSWFERFLSKRPSVTRLVKEIKNGKFSVAQSESFIQRVLEIKELHDRTIMGFEVHGFYVPEQVTAAQRRLPLRDKYRALPVVDDLVYDQPSGFKTQGHARGFSRS